MFKLILKLLSRDRCRAKRNGDKSILLPIAQDGLTLESTKHHANAAES